MPHAIEPFALILNPLLRIDVLAYSVSETILNLSFIGGFVRPLVTADPCDLIAFKLALVDGAVGPVKGALPVQKSVLKLSFVSVAIPELASALSVVHLANLKKFKNLSNRPFLKIVEIGKMSEKTYLSIFFVVDDVSSPIFNDKFRQLCWQESNLWQWFDIHLFLLI
jgi:hypothetical protein